MTGRSESMQKNTIRTLLINAHRDQYIEMARLLGDVTASDYEMTWCADYQYALEAMLAPIHDIIIECEFQIPETPEKDRHFRIFIDEDGYRGHNIQSTANVSSVFRPVGLTLQHLRKNDDKGTLTDADFGPLNLDLQPNTWYKMRLEVMGDQARTTVAGKTITATHPNLTVVKNKIGLNPGMAGGRIRNFKAWSVKN